MDKAKPPIVPEVPVPVLTDQQVIALLATCERTTFTDRRDLAVLRILIDCGLRREELVNLRLADIDFDRHQLWVEQGKGRRPRPVFMHPRTEKALDRYLRLRPRHPHHREEVIFLGKRGALGAGGLLQLVRRRGAQAGFPLYVHQLRHLSAHLAASEGMSVPDMMRLYGWKDSSMALRYGASAGTQRALEHAEALKIGDRF
jgi:integrase